MQDKIIIALCGKQYSGKSEAAKFIEMFYGFERVDAAKEMKIECAQLEFTHEFGMILGHLDDKVWLAYLESKDKSRYRKYLIDKGKELKQKYGEEYLIDKAIKNAKTNKVVIENLRTLGEYEYLKSLGAIIIRITSSRDVRAMRGKISQENDITETALDCVNVDFEIHNDQNRFVLFEKLFESLDELLP